MGTAYTPATQASGFRSNEDINTDRLAVQTALAAALSRNGDAPNDMNADLDMGTNRLLNVEEGVLGTDGVNLNQVTNVATNIANTLFNTGGAQQTSGDPITFNYGIATGSQGLNTRTEFDVNTLFGRSSLLGLTVIVNGVIQYPGSYSVQDTTNVIFSESLNTDDDILFIFGDLTTLPVFTNAAATLSETVATATAGQTVFTAPTYTIGNNQLMVHIDGVMQSLQDGDYTETSTTSITLDTAMNGGEKVVIRQIVGTPSSGVTAALSYSISATDPDPTAASVTYFVVPEGGTVSSINSVISGALATGDNVYTISIAGGSPTPTTHTITQSGSAAGDVDTTTITAGGAVNAGDIITLTSNGGNSAAINVNFTITIDRS